MAPSRKSTRASKPSRLGGTRTTAPTSGLFFGGTQLVQDNEDEEEEGQDQSYLYNSDADEDDEYAEPSTAAKRRQGNRKSSKKSGKAPANKPIDSDYDSDDKTIIELKKQGYKDEAVAKKLADEGRQQFSAKRISTRWLRLKKIVEQKEEERLDDELSDWHIGEASSGRRIRAIPC